MSWNYLHRRRTEIPAKESHATQSRLWIGYQTKENIIDVVNYVGSEYYTGWGMRKNLYATVATKTTPPFIARDLSEALEIAYLRILV